ncbi:PorT family protein [Terrimonas sp. NA20]|uniref:PorT family protein n=1 Tax=Terrimonas ginsenosidimutans TaxID=2908004 RepID=A0ABS9KTP3_9BACT|nr:porin family protein [Terrimonas ginsenosidimutans]MCG2615662.1 PorT family protein [Terrimonas ginsenosidimutans]
MKVKFLLPLLACMFVSTVTMAQFHIGFKGGANITKVDGESFKDKFSYGYSLGVFAEIGLGEKFHLQPEVLFNQYSSTVDSNYRHVYQNIFSSNQSKVKLNYLSIPILLNYKLLGNFLSLQAGPQFSILMDQSKNLLQNGGNAFSKGDFAMVGGVQLKLSSIRISGRYVVGLNDINDIDNQDKWKNQGFQVGVGFAL